MPYYVYVILLDPAVLHSRKFLAENPALNPRRACFYVGQSSHDPETRFWQHKDGYKSNPFVKKYGLGLCPKYYNHLNPLQTRKDAEALEAQLTVYLRSKGHGVWSY